MTIQSLPHKTVMLHRALHIGGITILGIAGVAVLITTNRSARVRWLETATTTALIEEAAKNTNDLELNLVLDQHLIQDGKDEQAFTLMGSLIKRFPNSANCWDHYARAAAQTNNVLDALNGYRQEVRIDPGAAAAYAVIGTMYIKAGLMSEGLAEIDTARRLHKDANVNVLLWAQALESKGRYEEAWRCLTDSAHSDPKQDTLWATVGEVAIKLHREDEAEAMMIRRINMTPDYDVAYARGPLAHLLVSTSHDPKTLDEALYIAKLGAHYETAQAQVALAEILMIKKDLKGARTVLENGLKMDTVIGIKTKNQDCLRMLAEIANAEGRTKDAQVYLAELPQPPTPQLIALRTTAEAVNAPSQAKVEYAGALEKLGDYAEAAEVYDDVIATNQNIPGIKGMLERCRDEAMSKLNVSEKASAVAHPSSLDQRALHAQP